MGEIAWFIPGCPEVARGPLARYRPPTPAGAADGYIRQLTSPGALVLDLFCQGPTFLREAVRAGCRAIGANANPIGLLIAGLGLEGTPANLDAVFTRLADAPKETPNRRSIPLHRHILSLYRSRCPVCGGEGTAEWFAWDREARYPYAKAVRCPRCGRIQEGPTDEADMIAARRLDRKGFAYYFALDRVAPLKSSHRARAAELVDLYTPRNLSALVDILIRLEGLELERPARAALQGALLETMDRASSLDPHGEERPRPRLLRPPARFLERNVWYLLEATVARAMEWAPEPVRRAPGLKELFADPTPAYTLLPLPAREVARHLAPGTVSLILADPPRPDGVFWALCALWAGWLWESPASQAMRPLLGRRRLEWDRHQEAFQAALSAVGPLLAPDGYLVILFAEPDENLVASACQAASAAGYDLVGWGASTEVGCRLVWRWAPRSDAGGRPSGRGGIGAGPAPPTDNAEAPPAVAETVRETLQARAEPTPRFLLTAAVHTELARRRWNGPFGEVVQAVRCGWESLELEALEMDLLWLPDLDARRLDPPLADRAEEIVRSLLTERSPWATDDLLLAVYRALDGPLTPEPSLVLLCMRSYGVEDGGVWRLREEDDPARRAEELENLRRDLEELGRRLRYRPARGRGWDLRWRERGRDVYLFRLSATAALGDLIPGKLPLPRGGRPCWVLPGGRAELLAEKLRRDPRLARAAWGAGWQFVKFRHLRRLIAEGVDRRTFAVMLGLDPATGPRGVQIPLMMTADDGPPTTDH
ncbi:MAG: hypothetical protein H5T61_02610 [Thermoflexales bacterium]|nr:hypothetical protein [Thermoflexales bacterium]